MRCDRQLAVLIAAATALLPLFAADFRPPAGKQPVARRPGATTILPGGRVLTPLGKQYLTGPGPFGIAISRNGRVVVTADGGPNRYSLTVVERDPGSNPRVKHLLAPRDVSEEKDEDEADWRSVFMGLAFVDNQNLWASEGESGKVRLIDARTGRKRGSVSLDSKEFRDSYSGDLAYDGRSRMLYALDQANFRVVVIDAEKRRVVSSVRAGRLPFSITLAPNGKRAYVTNLGMFEYRKIPGVDLSRIAETGLPFPAFGFPSPEAVTGVRRQTGEWKMTDVPGLGDPNVPESNSLAVINLANPAEPRVEKFIRTGIPFGRGSLGGSSPSGVVATEERIYVSNGHNDSITVIDAKSLAVEKEIVLRIPKLEAYRGVLPIGLAVDKDTGWLLAAEAGINAVGVIDAQSLRVLGHIPVAWFPTRMVIQDGAVWVSCAKGHGTGPNASRRGPEPGGFHGERRRGSINAFSLPDLAELPRLTQAVLENNGFIESPAMPAALPEAIEHVVIIVKENRTYDEVFGDIDKASNGPADGYPDLARFGRRGFILPRRGQLQQRLSLRKVNITPNHHALAERFAFSDNFYADSEVSVDGHHWLVGSYPNAWTESTLMAAYGGQKQFRLGDVPGRLQFPGSNSSVHPEEQLEAGAIWHHFERHGVSFRNFGEGFELAGAYEGPGVKPTGASFITNVPMPDPLYRNTSRQYPNYNMNIPDQFRATQFIREIEEMFAKPNQPLPKLLYIHLPNDHMARARPEDGYPFEASFVADNDYALGRIVEYLSNSKWWPKMAILVTEDDAQGGVDHVDSHRTLFLAISPYARRNYVAKVNSSFPGLLKTAFRLLRIPPLNLYDATAPDLADCFTMEADFTPFRVQPISPDLFEPEKAREPTDPRPSPRMDDPRVLREQHRQ
jgi:YVTN family beta-propeller protein